mgnify:FL=1
MDIPDHIQGLIFDCDGTLVDTPPLYATAWMAALAEFGARLELEWFRPRAGLSEALLLDDVERHFGIPMPRAAVAQLTRAHVMENLHSLREIQAVADIARAQAGRLQLAVASSGPAEIVQATLEATGLRPLFNQIVTIEDVANAKPAPDLFLEAARRMGLAPSTCLVFEDSAQGLQAALLAGMPAIDINKLIADTTSLPDGLRRATPADQPEVEALIDAAYRHYIPRIGARPGPMQDDYAQLIEAGQVLLHGAPGALQAVLVLIPQEDALLLDNIAVSPAAQGQGLGRRLLDHAEAVARAAGYKAIKLYTHELMTENRAIYAKTGYIETHFAREKGLNRVYLRKDL